MMVGVALGVILTAALVITLISSSFIVFILLTSKQYKNSTSLLHLQLMTVASLLSLLFIVFSTPSLIQGRWVTGEGPATTTTTDTNNNNSQTEEKGSTAPSPSPSWPPQDDQNNNSKINNNNNNLTEEDEEEEGGLVVAGYEVGGGGVWCHMQGFLLLILHTAGVWMVVGLHCDKYCAIATPLRYTQLVTRPRVAVFSCLAWLLGLGVATPPLAASYSYTPNHGVCLPACHTATAAGYVWALAGVCVLLPLVVLVVVNTRIVLIARHHQHRIFSAIFEVMMSAQATVTHQKNPFDLPRKKHKSVWSVVEQVVAFLGCCCPWFLTGVWESVQGRPAHPYWSLLATTTLVITPLAHVMVYGAKSRGVRQALRHYLRKKLYKTEMRQEIQARVPSAANSRRPSITSTLALPLTRSLQRRMSDCLLPAPPPPAQEDKPRLHRRSSDLSWHPLEEGTPSPTRLRRPLGSVLPVEASPAASHSTASVSNFLTVPTFEAARRYNPPSASSNYRVTLSTSSLDSDGSASGREEEITMTFTPSPDPGLCSPHFLCPTLEPLVTKSRSLELGVSRCGAGGGEGGGREGGPWRGGAGERGECHTPLLVSALQKPARSASLSSSSPHVLRALEAILSVRISQSLLRRGAGWGGSRGSLERLAAFLRESRQHHEYTPCLPVPRPPTPPSPTPPAPPSSTTLNCPPSPSSTNTTPNPPTALTHPCPDPLSTTTPDTHSSLSPSRTSFTTPNANSTTTTTTTTTTNSSYLNPKASSSSTPTTITPLTPTTNPVLPNPLSTNPQVSNSTPNPDPNNHQPTTTLMSSAPCSNPPPSCQSNHVGEAPPESSSGMGGTLAFLPTLANGSACLSVPQDPSPPHETSLTVP